MNPQPGPGMSLVDAHIHLWDIDQMRVSWWRTDLNLPRAAHLDDFRRATSLVPGGVSAAIAVQAADTAGEAAWLAEQAGGDSLVRRVVLQYDARSDPGAWAGMAQALISAPRAGRFIAGVRLATPTGAVDFGDILGLDALAAGLAADSRVLELLIRPEQLPAAAALADKHPDLRIVICHLAAGGAVDMSAWREGIAAVATRLNVRAKVSGLLREPADDARVREIVGHAVAHFGADRLMFGSDWPMRAHHARYPDVVVRTAAVLPPMRERAREQFWAGTARRVYEFASAE